MSTSPTKISEPGSGAAAIGKSVVVKGQIYSREDLFVDGEVEGTIEVQEHCLTVGPNGRVKAGLTAREVQIYGTVHGNMEASEKIAIHKEAKVVGDVKSVRLIVQDGAYFKGSVDMVRQELPRIPEKPVVKQAQPVQEKLPQAGAPGGQKKA